MKRVGNLFNRISSFNALIEAAQGAAKGKKSKPNISQFLYNLENEAFDLECELLSKTYYPRPYNTFTVHDPKEREICAAPFRDRVVHHSVSSVLESIFEKTFIYDTYACRKKKGVHKAIKRAQYFSKRYEYFLKLDVRKFFDSVDHTILKNQIRRKIKDKNLLCLINIFIDHPVPWTNRGKGIPIGNLTSQHFANFYLSGLDHFIKEYLRIEGYVRYMDDFLLFADEKDTLWDAAARIETYLHPKLELKLKKEVSLLAPVSQGISFLGMRVFPGVIRISRKGLSRFCERVQKQNCHLNRGIIDHEQWSRSLAGLVGHVKQAETRNLRASFFQRSGTKGAITV